MLFSSAAIAGGVISIFGATPGMLIDSGMYTFGRVGVLRDMNVYAMKMAGVFMISTCTLSLRTGIIPRWMRSWASGWRCFCSEPWFLYWAPLVFPLWWLLISVHILRENLGTPK